MEIHKDKSSEQNEPQANVVKPKRQYKPKRNPKYLKYVNRANAKGFPMELTESHFIELETCECHYCGDSATGFDRVDSRRGYLLNNVVPACGTCNIMKYTMTSGEFERQVEKIYKRFNKS